MIKCKNMNYSEPIDPYTGMTKNEKKIAVILHVLMYISAVIFCVFICALFSGCKSVEYVPVIEHHTDTLIKTNVQRDSVYVHDSVTVTQKGDTVLMDRWHTKYVEKQVHDTTYVAKHDTIPQPYPVEKKVEKPLTVWQSFRMVLGTIALIALVLYVIAIIAKKRFL